MVKAKTEKDFESVKTEIRNITQYGKKNYDFVMKLFKKKSKGRK